MTRLPERMTIELERDVAIAGGAVAWIARVTSTTFAGEASSDSPGGALERIGQVLDGLEAGGLAGDPAGDFGGIPVRATPAMPPSSLAIAPPRSLLSEAAETVLERLEDQALVGPVSAAKITGIVRELDAGDVAKAIDELVEAGVLARSSELQNTGREARALGVENATLPLYRLRSPDEQRDNARDDARGEADR